MNFNQTTKKFKEDDTNNIWKNKPEYTENSKQQYLNPMSFERANFLPNINVNNKTFPVPSRKYESIRENQNWQLPSISAQPDIEWMTQNIENNTLNERDNKDEIISNKSEIMQRRSLEKSIKESLKALSETKVYLKGHNKSTRHLMLEINEFYLDMAEQLRILKGNLLDNVQYEIPNTDDCTEIPRYDIEVGRLLKSIEDDDQKLAENMKILQDIKRTKHTNKKPEVQAKINDRKKVLNAKNNKEALENNAAKNKKNSQAHDKDFIAKNKEIAKDYSTTKLWLTDEEKLKLKSLLSDIDVEEEITAKASDETAAQHKEDDQINPHITEAPADLKNDDNKDDISIFVNGFKFDPDENELLNNLNLKILDLQEQEVEDQITNKIETYDDLKKAESEGKNWKFPLLQTRLKNVEKKLASILVEKENETEKKEEFTMFDTENTADMAKEYRESVYDISLDIEEIEYQLDKVDEEEKQ